MCRLGNPARDTFNVPYDLFPLLLIKLLITFGCYGRQGHIPQVLSAAWAQKNPHCGTSLSPAVSSRSHFHIATVWCSVCGPFSETTLSPDCYHPLEFQSKLQVSKVQDTNGSFHYSPPFHPHLPPLPLWDPHSGFIVGGSAPFQLSRNEDQA